MDDFKSLTAWAVVHSENEIDCWDWRIPIYWFKKQATAEKKKHTFSDSRVVKVRVIKYRRKRNKS